MEHNLPIKIDLPEHFLEEEVRCDYLVSSKMKKVWAIEIDLLREFDRVCKIYNLRWSVSSGTTLGAVRHGGFIPWDDDIDVEMPRADFDILCKNIKKEIKEPYFFSDGRHQKRIFQCHATLRNSLTTAIYAGCNDKLNKYNQGIFLDIFALDTIPEDNSKRDEYICQLEKEFTYCQQIMIKVDFYRPKVGRGTNAYVKHLCRHIYDTIIKHKHYIYMCALLKKYKNKESSLCANLMLFPFVNNRILKKSFFHEIKQLNFEWFKVPVPNEAEEYLSTMYGNNWKVPIIGTSLHNGIYFDPEQSYIEYYQSI